MILQESADLEQSTKGLCLEIRPEKKKCRRKRNLRYNALKENKNLVSTSFMWCSVLSRNLYFRTRWYDCAYVRKASVVGRALHKKIRREPC